MTAPGDLKELAKQAIYNDNVLLETGNITSEKYIQNDMYDFICVTKFFFVPIAKAAALDCEAWRCNTCSWRSTINNYQLLLITNNSSVTLYSVQELSITN
jgi:hypothetical protein